MACRVSHSGPVWYRVDRNGSLRVQRFWLGKHTSWKKASRTSPRRAFNRPAGPDRWNFQTTRKPVGQAVPENGLAPQRQTPPPVPNGSSWAGFGQAVQASHNSLHGEIRRRGSVDSVSSGAAEGTETPEVLLWAAGGLTGISLMSVGLGLTLSGADGLLMVGLGLFAVAMVLAAVYNGGLDVKRKTNRKERLFSAMLLLGMVALAIFSALLIVFV